MSEQEYKITGKITAINPKEDISNGQYKKITFVVTNQDGYKDSDKDYAFEIFEKSDVEKSKVDNFVKFNKVGQVVDVSFNIDCRAGNKGYWTTLKAWKVFKAEGNEPTEGTDPDPATEEEAPW
jgi:hypothetical protein